MKWCSAAESAARESDGTAAPVTPRTRAKRFKALFKRKGKAGADGTPKGGADEQRAEGQSKGFNFFSRTR